MKKKEDTNKYQNYVYLNLKFRSDSFFLTLNFIVDENISQNKLSTAVLNFYTRRVQKVGKAESGKKRVESSYIALYVKCWKKTIIHK